MLDTLGIFILPFLVCLLMSIILSYMGTHVLDREIIFIDIALAQVAAVGVIIAHIIVGAHEGSLISYACALGFTLIASGFYSFVRKRLA